MKKMISLIVAFCCMAASANAQKIFSDRNAEARDVKPFTAIRVKGALTVYLSQGSTEAVAVSARDPKYRDNIKTVVNNGVLTVSYEQSGVVQNPQAKAYISYKDLTGLDISGASDVYFQDIFKGNTCKVVLTGASKVKGPLELSNIDLQMTGASTAALTGKAMNLKLTSTGASDFKSPNFTVNHAIIRLTGASDAGLTIKMSLDAKVSGASSIKYSGNPEKVIQDVSGASSVRKIN